MATNLENIRIVTEFNRIWQQQGTSSDSIAAGIKSFSRETFREIDECYIVIGENKKPLDPQNHYQEIKFARNTDLEKTEGEAWDLLIEWGNKNEEGRAAWFSPQLKKTNAYFNGYPFNKVCLYEIAYTFEFPPKKVLLSTTIYFDTPKDHCLDMAKSLQPELENEQDPEILRNKIFELPGDYNLIKILELIAKSKNGRSKTYSQESISYFVNQIKAGKNPEEITWEMQQKGIIGEYSISCPPSIMTRNSATLNFLNPNNTSEKKILKCVECPLCKKTVDAEIYDGEIHCPPQPKGCGGKLPLRKN